MDLVNDKNTSFLSVLERFSYIYILTYILSMQMSPWGYVIEKFSVRPLTVFFAKLCGVHITTFSGGSGDTTYDYFKIIILLIISLAFLLIFYIKNKSFQNSRLRIWTFTALRYFLALYLLIYGLSKVFPLQFGNGLHAYSLTKTYGESSPMNLLWNFMGYSRPYTIFAGLSEVIAGLFFLFRKTTLLGALTSFGVMLNVFLLNLFYDVPVKIFSGHLLLFSMIFIAYQIKPLIDYFILNRNSQVLSFPGFNFTSNENKFISIFKKIFIGIVFLLTIGSFVGLSNFVAKKHEVKSELEGIHRILSFDKKEGNTLTSEETNWNKIIVYEDDGWMIQFDNGYRKYENITIDTINKKLESDSISSLNYTIKKDTFNLLGNWKGDTLNITTLRTDIEDLLLNKRKFQFINETPFNH